MINQLLKLCKTNNITIPEDIEKKFAGYIPTQTDFDKHGNQPLSPPDLPAVPATGQPICGLTNGGRNLCYFNATMQALCACDMFQALLKNGLDTVSGNLITIFDAIKTTTMSTNLTTSISGVAQALIGKGHTSEATKNLQNTANNTGGQLQQDAKELLTDVINGLLEEEQVGAIRKLLPTQDNNQQPKIDPTIANKICEEALVSPTNASENFQGRRTTLGLKENITPVQIIAAIPLTQSVSSIQLPLQAHVNIPVRREM
jgi:hypothetical protein